MLQPEIKEKVLGRAEVRAVFKVSKVGTIAGCYVLNGIISRASDGIRVIRDNIVVYEGKISSLKRFKEDVREVQAGYECGLTIENFNDIKEGDILENYILEKIPVKGL
jgi:translation initiation factor IF-2